ncbi:putative RNA-directed DNA polymerase [Helianthus annuus]|nr:putative RNA-directed DNA polymerase [Helianthus annuus]
MVEDSSSFQTVSVPKFDGDYDHWSLVIETLLRSKEFWTVVEEWYTPPRQGVEMTSAQQASDAAKRLQDLKARNYLFQSIDKHILKTITHKSTAKQIWDATKIKYQGNARVKRAQLQRLRREFETLEMKAGESVTAYFGRVMVIANDMRICGENMPYVKIVEKVLRTMTENFNFIVCSIEESKDIDEMTVDELQNSLLVHEQKLQRKIPEEQALKTDYEPSVGRSRGRDRFSTNRGRGRGRGRSSFDKSTVECYKSHQTGHFQYECPTGDRSANYIEHEDNDELLLMARVDDVTTKKEGTWFLDSACSNHMTGVKEWFVQLDETYTHSVRLGNDYRLRVRGIGEVRICVEGITRVITNVYYIPELTSNLLSIGQLQEKRVTFVVQEGVCKVYHPQKGLIISSRMTKNRMFPVHVISKPYSPTCLQVSESDTHIWHKRFAHVNHKALRTMQYRQMVKGLPKVVGKTKVCETCAIGKQQREVIPNKSNWRATEKLQLIHTDLCGPITPSSQTGKRYVLVFIDDYTRKT